MHFLSNTISTYCNTTTTVRQPSLLPGDPDVEFDGEVDVGDPRDDSDVDVEGLLDLDSKGNVIVGNHGKVGVDLAVVAAWYCSVSEGGEGGEINVEFVSCKFGRPGNGAAITFVRPLFCFFYRKTYTPWRDEEEVPTNLIHQFQMGGERATYKISRSHPLCATIFHPRVL